MTVPKLFLHFWMVKITGPLLPEMITYVPRRLSVKSNDNEFTVKDKNYNK